VPETDVPLTLTVEVVPVLGEEPGSADDNRASYSITFN
jgi:hypothetical protein